MLIDRRVANDPESIESLIKDLNVFDAAITVGLDVLGGIASLLQAVLAGAGFQLVHVPGLAVKTALVKEQLVEREKAILEMRRSSPINSGRGVICASSMR